MKLVKQNQKLDLEKLAKMTPEQIMEQEDKDPIALLMRHYDYADREVDKLKEYNLSVGIPSDKMYLYLGMEPIRERNLCEKWLRQVTSPQSGKFYNTQMLKNAGIIDDDEETEYDDKTFPIRELNRLVKLRTVDGKCWITRGEMWLGLSRVGNIIKKAVNNLDYYVKPTVNYQMVDPNNDRLRSDRALASDRDRFDTKHVRVAKIPFNKDGHEVTGRTILLEEFTPEKAQMFLRFVKEPLGAGKGTHLYLHNYKTNQTTPCTLEEFLDDFNKVWEIKNQKTPEIKLDREFFTKMKDTVYQ